MIDYKMNEMVNEIARQTEDLILEQLNDLVSRDLLVIEKGPVSLVRDLSDRIQVRQTARLTLKEKEYIEKLEAENRILKERLAAISVAIGKSVE